MIDTKTEKILNDYGKRFNLQFSVRYGLTLIKRWRERRKIVEYMLDEGITSPQETVSTPELSDVLNIELGTVRCLMGRKHIFGQRDDSARLAPSDFAKSWGGGYYIKRRDGIDYLKFLKKLGA